MEYLVGLVVIVALGFLWHQQTKHKVDTSAEASNDAPYKVEPPVVVPTVEEIAAVATVSAEAVAAKPEKKPRAKKTADAKKAPAKKTTKKTVAKKSV